MASLRQIPPPRLRNLWTRLGWVDGKPPNLVQPHDAMYLWMAQFIAQTTALSSDQIDLILNVFGQDIKQYGTKFADDLEGATGKLTIAHLMIADSRYASISGAEIFLDLTSGDVSRQLLRPAALVMGYNMGEIYIRTLGSLNRQTESKDA